MKICVIMGDRIFERMLCLELSDWGFDVVSESQLGTYPDIPVICDIDECGYDKVKDISQSHEIYGICRDFRENSPSSGLCVCIFKRPFLMSELRSVLQKFVSGDKTEAPKISETTRVSEFGRRKNMLVSNHRANEAVFGSHSIALSKTEADVLKILCDKRGEAVSREEISRVFGSSDGNICDVYICKLRRKLDNALGVKFIYTVKGKGYMLK